MNSGEYKLMGLAPYGEPKYVDLILEKLIDLQGRRHVPARHAVLQLLHRPDDDERASSTRCSAARARPAESRLTQREMDIAASIQAVTEEVVLRLARTLHAETGEENLCLAGGVALNCVANGRVLREGPFKEIWVQPAAGDAGGALGAAAVAWHEFERQAAHCRNGGDACAARISGRGSRDDEIRSALDAAGAKYVRLADDDRLSNASPRSSTARTSSAGFRGAWNSVRARSARVRSSAIRAARRCSR